MTIAAALGALTAGERGRARDIASAGDSPLARALTAYLASDADGTVYVRPAAFKAFINGGGNVGLYKEVSEALARVYDQVRPASVLDIGCGDGRALLPSLAAGHRPSRLTLVEPSAALLDLAVRGVADEFDGIELNAHNTGVELFAADADWFDVAQSTIALHALAHEARDKVLTALAPKVAEVGSCGQVVAGTNTRRTRPGILSRRRTALGLRGRSDKAAGPGAAQRNGMTQARR